MYNEFVLTKKNFIRTVTEIELEWLIELAPQYYHPENFPEGEVRTAIDQIYKRKQTQALQQTQDRKQERDKKDQGSK
ncbi:MAG: hypothetical protein EZS28_020227 [Streblomastix strix]|uniref:DEAD-box helicase OB fold domain-containing protein n=1 Tax=Streblomastix strix TaxID=222440 RepID=A0A5J4VNQ2_9EUKA|nr:MAG: hypothetical protein EZS28_020227 [Streblomastix strix]